MMMVKFFVAVSHKAAEPHKFLFGESCLYTV